MKEKGEGRNDKREGKSTYYYNIGEREIGEYI